MPKRLTPQEIELRKQECLAQARAWMKKTGRVPAQADFQPGSGLPPFWKIYRLFGSLKPFRQELGIENGLKRLYRKEKIAAYMKEYYAKNGRLPARSKILAKFKISVCTLERAIGTKKIEKYAQQIGLVDEDRWITSLEEKEKRLVETIRRKMCLSKSKELAEIIPYWHVHDHSGGMYNYYGSLVERSLLTKEEFIEFGEKYIKLYLEPTGKTGLIDKLNAKIDQCKKELGSL